MLQQTTVATVKPRFERFVARWPSVAALAAASDEEILSEWAGLGYYARARNLIACARQVARRGSFPPTAAELCQLPGIGAYTASAIAAIAFGEKTAAVDTNVNRLIARLKGLRQPAVLDIHSAVLKLMAEEVPGDVLQALMDLGATVCRPKQPRCGACPLHEGCAAFASGDPEGFPAPRPRKVRPHRYGTAWCTERDGYVWLIRRQAKGLLGGMAALPGTEWSNAASASSASLGTVRHVFTHFSLDLVVESTTEPVGEGWWQPLDELDRAGLPTLYRRAIEIVLGRRAACLAAA